MDGKGSSQTRQAMEIMEEGIRPRNTVKVTAHRGRPIRLRLRSREVTVQQATDSLQHLVTQIIRYVRSFEHKRNNHGETCPALHEPPFVGILPHCRRDKKPWIPSSRF